MSADNGIYIGRFLDVNGLYEYRVIHAQAIENCEYTGAFPKKLTDAYRVTYYGNARVLKDASAAQAEADRLYQEILSSDFPIVEYGVRTVCYDTPFPDMTVAEANKYILGEDDRADKAAAERRAKEVTVKCLINKGMFQTEYFVLVQDWPSLTPVIWRGWVDRNFVRVDYSKGMPMEGYHFGELHCYKIAEDVKREDLGAGGTRSQLMLLIEFPDGGFGARRLWVEPNMVTGQW